MSDKLILRTSVSPYGDTTKGSVLSTQELDGNLITLKGAQISSVSLIGNSLNVVELNGSNFNVDLSQFTNDTTITGGTFANSTLILSNNTGGTVTITGFTMTAQSETYTNLTATTTTIGGIPAGSTFSGLTMQQMWDKLLYPYQPPAFTTFSFTYLNPQTSNIFEVGTGIIDFTNSNFTYATSNATNVSAGTITITQNYPSTITIKSGLDGSSNNTSIPQAQFTNQPIIISSSTATTRTIFTISGKNTNLGDMLNATISASWQWKVYVGQSASATLPTQNQITGLTIYNSLSTTFASTYTIPSTENYVYICFPTSMGNLNSITSGGFNVAMATSATDPFYSGNSGSFNYGLVTITNRFGIPTPYKVYRTFNPLGGISIITT